LGDFYVLDEESASEIPHSDSLKKLYASGEYEALKKKVQSQPELLDGSRDEITLLFKGPKGLQVIDIVIFKRKGMGEGVIMAKIRQEKAQYGKLSLEELQGLKELGFSDALLEAMLAY
jgi:hypothetical protein